MAAQRQWREDILGPRFRMLPIEVGDGQNAVIIAQTLPDPAPAPAADPAPDALRKAQPSLQPASTGHPAIPADTAVIYLHGWSDYFFHHRLADYYASLGIAFYAIDLRRYGRSLLIDAAGGPEHWAPDTSGADTALNDEAAAQALAAAAVQEVEDDLPGRVLTGH